MIPQPGDGRQYWAGAPWGAALLLRALEVQKSSSGRPLLEELERLGRHEAATREHALQGHELLFTLEQLKAAGTQQWTAHRRAMQEAAPLAESGVHGISTTQAAGLLGVSERRITKLLNGEKLRGEKVRGRWVVDPLSVADEQRRRAEFRC